MWFLDATASSLRSGTILAPQHEQKLTADESSEPGTDPRVMPAERPRRERSVRCFPPGGRTFPSLTGSCAPAEHEEEEERVVPSFLKL